MIDICEVENLSTKVAFLDELFAHPNKPISEMLASIDNKHLREIKGTYSRISESLIFSIYLEKMATSGMLAVKQYADEIGFPGLHKFAAEQALKETDLEAAYKAFVKFGDFQGIKLVKKLERLEVRLY
jgi:hypothetical protein